MERMDEYRMARRVLMASTGYTEVKFDGWREGGLAQHLDDGGWREEPGCICR